MGAYWDCIESVAHVQGDQGRDGFYKQAEMAAAFCITYAVALMLSMYCACRAIGWHVVARSAVTWISIGTALLGLAVFAIGVVLQALHTPDPHRWWPTTRPSLVCAWYCAKRIARHVIA